MPEVAQIASTAWWQKWKPVRCRRYRNLFVLDHGLPPQNGKIAVSLDAESFFENLVSNLLQPGGVGLRLFLRANGEHLYALRGLFRGASNVQPRHCRGCCAEPAASRRKT